MHVSPERPVSKPPFLIDYARSFSSYIFQQPNVSFAQIAHATNGTVVHDGYEIEGRDCFQVPFHVREYHERGRGI